MEANKTIALIMQQVIVTAHLPKKITDDIYLRKASDHEIFAFKDNFFFWIGSRGRIVEFCYENSPVNYITDSGAPYEYIPGELDRSQWRYYVLETQSDRDNLRLLDLVSNLTDIPLYAGVIGDAHGLGYVPSRISDLLHPSSMEDTYELSQTSLDKLTELYISYLNIDNKDYQYSVFRGLTMLDELNTLPRHSSFKVIGLFAIIELLLTHKPLDASDSISKQMKSKIQLMANRLESSLNYDYYFGTLSRDKVWSELYGYRSAVAHGDHPKVDKLKDSENAIAFLEKVAKLLIKQCIREPQLMYDLKHC